MGFFGALLGTGGPSPNATYAQQTAALGAGKKKAIRSYRQGLTEAEGVISPYMEGGRRGQELYESSIGVRPYDDAFRTFEADPFRAGSDLAARNEADRVFSRYNYYNRADSGDARVGVPMAASKLYDQRVENWRNRLAGLGQQGMGLAQFGAGLKYGTGTKIGDTESGYAQKTAELMGYRDNALRDRESRGVNNLLALGGLAVKGAGLFV